MRDPAPTGLACLPPWQFRALARIETDMFGKEDDMVGTHRYRYCDLCGDGESLAGAAPIVGFEVGMGPRGRTIRGRDGESVRHYICEGCLEGFVVLWWSRGREAARDSNFTGERR